METRFRQLSLRAASLMVPSAARGEWLREWQSELWYIAADAATAFCFGAFRDAVWLRRNHAAAPKRSFLTAPAHCLSFLAVLAGTSGVLSFYLQAKLPFQEAPPMPAYQGVAMGLFFYAILLGIALTFGDNPSRHQAFRGWIFLALKLALLLPIVYGALMLSIVFARIPLLGNAIVVGVILLFRWVMADQRRRCPVCLRLLTKPVRIGVASDAILDWYGCESICSSGHGVMQVGAGSTSFHGNQTWLNLDDSWSGLFPEGRQ